ncbi:Abscisic stress-ripening protein 2 [Spatholobus suberectus]|nr:Abscisic stress-ripening protein 2 [Spatholobus suberectus]
MGAVAAGAFALHEKHKARKDPEHAHRHKIEEEIAAAAAVGAGGFAFHEHHEKKEAKKEYEETHGKKHHHFLGSTVHGNGMLGVLDSSLLVAMKRRMLRVEIQRGKEYNPWGMLLAKW